MNIDENVVEFNTSINIERRDVINIPSTSF
jgi:hypothetical protein